MEPGIQSIDGRLQDFKGREQDEGGDRQGPDGLVFVVAVGVVPVRFGIGQAVGEQAQQARKPVGGAVHGIGQHRQGSGEQAQHQLQQGHADVDGQGHQQHPLNLEAVVVQPRRRQGTTPTEHQARRDWRRRSAMS